MPYTWVDGEVITAEKLNEISKEPLMIDIDNISYSKINYMLDQDSAVHTSGYTIKDFSKCLNICIIKDQDFYEIRGYKKTILYPIDTSTFPSDEKCIIKETESIIVDDTYLVIKDPTAITDGTGPKK